MVNTERIVERMKELNCSVERLSAEMGVSLNTLKNKLNNITQFKVTEIVDLCFCLRFTNEERDVIFFSGEVGKTDTLEGGEA